MFHQPSLGVNEYESDFGILKYGNKLKALNIKDKIHGHWMWWRKYKNCVIVLFIFSDHAVTFC